MEQKTDLYYRLLMEKYLADKSSFEETEELFDYLNNDQSDRVLLNHIKNGFEQSYGLPKRLPDAIADRMWTVVESRIEAPGQPATPVYRSWGWYLSAAAVLAAIFISVGFYNFFSNKSLPANTSVHAKVKSAGKDILPGGNKAVLKLANGSSIILDDVKAGLLTQQGNIAIRKTGEGQLTFDLQSAQLAGQSDVKNAFNTITTPKGGQYQVVLPDGSKVWLNANSSLTFPTVFTRTARNVELHGEAYFEIAKDVKRPFRVRTDRQNIQVLGTHFNVMAYDEEDETRTTLLEGSILVDNDMEREMLKPGQQSELNRHSGQLNVKNVDPEEAVAWKDGYFLFQGDNIFSIMRKISRWYDVEVSYEGNLENKEFAGMISRFTNISEVLKMLELTGDVHFKVDGRRIKVMP